MPRQIPGHGLAVRGDEFGEDDTLPPTVLLLEVPDGVGCPALPGAQGFLAFLDPHDVGEQDLLHLGGKPEALAHLQPVRGHLRALGGQGGDHDDCGEEAEEDQRGGQVQALGEGGAQAFVHALPPAHESPHHQHRRQPPQTT